MLRSAGALTIAILLLGATVARADEATGSTGSAHEGWYAEFDAAAAAAKEQGKDLFIDFTGSDWCGWCMKLEEEVFSHPEFLDAVKKDFVLLALDFPRSEEVKAKVPDPEQNAALRDKYGVTGYPTVLLMTPDGVVFGRTGYQRGGAEAYVQHVAELREKGKKALADVKEFEKSYETAEGEKKTELRDQAIEKLGGMKPTEIGAEVYADVVSKAVTDESTPEEVKIRGMKALLKSGKADDAVKAKVRELDPKNEKGLLEILVNQEIARTRAEKEAVAAAMQKIEDLDALGPIHDEKIAANLYTLAALFNYKYLDRKEEAKKWAQKAKDAGVENPRAQAFLDQVLGS